MLSNIYKALAHPVRREILAILRSGPRLSGDLADRFEMSWPSLSRHLAVLKDADLITAERQGTKILYRVKTSVVEDAAAALLALAGTRPAHDETDGSENALSDIPPNPESEE